MRLQHTFLALLLGLVALPAAQAGTLAGKSNKCIDVVNGQFVNGGHVQLYDCSSSNVNQQWSLSNGQLKAGGKCLDLAGGYQTNGASLQLWDCYTGSKNQAWEQAGNNIRLTGTNFCLDVRNGSYVNGGTVQLYTCDWRGSASNQAWTLGGSSSGSSVAARSDSSTYCGYPAISIDAFMQKNTFCAWLKDPIVAAARDIGVNATFLASICIVESSCTVPTSNQGGPWQFTDDATWNVYGGAGKDRKNPWDAAYAAARYYKDLLSQTNGDLDKAMRLYNGPVSDGGSATYAPDTKTWMSGGSVW